MATVLVTGGTGVLGSHLAPALVAAGHQVRALSRHASAATVVGGATAVVGDVRTGAGLDDAATDVSVVIHAATNAQWRARSTEVDGTRHVLDAAAKAGVGHFVYVSIVGVDRHRFPYYRAKFAAEQLVERASVPWTIQRATQFHDLLDRFMGLRVFPATERLAFQPIDVGEVAARLTQLVDEGPSGRAPDLGGPEVLTVRELTASRRGVTGKRTLVVPVPRLGFLREFDEGVHLAPDHRYGRVTWTGWLASNT